MIYVIAPQPTCKTTLFSAKSHNIMSNSDIVNPNLQPFKKLTHGNYHISKNAPVLQAIIRAYKGQLSNHFNPCKPL